MHVMALHHAVEKANKTGEAYTLHMILNTGVEVLNFALEKIDKGALWGNVEESHSRWMLIDISAIMTVSVEFH